MPSRPRPCAVRSLRPRGRRVPCVLCLPSCIRKTGTVRPPRRPRPCGRDVPLRLLPPLPLLRRPPRNSGVRPARGPRNRPRQPSRQPGAGGPCRPTSGPPSGRSVFRAPGRDGWSGPTGTSARTFARPRPRARRSAAPFSAVSCRIWPIRRAPAPSGPPACPILTPCPPPRPRPRGRTGPATSPMPTCSGPAARRGASPPAAAPSRHAGLGALGRGIPS